MFVKKYAIYELAAAQPSPILNACGCPIITLHKGLGGDHNSPEEAVQYLKDNLGGRHAEAEPKGSYDPGHDNIVVFTKDNVFCNSWCGPWTD